MLASHPDPEDGPRPTGEKPDDQPTPEETIAVPSLDGAGDAGDETVATSPGPVAVGPTGRAPGRSLLPERIGGYPIVDELGRGGMGVVYVAVDPRLERRVALKVLPAEVAGNPDALSRFEREARLLASINHVNIATIHSLENADGLHFLTLELIDGETLSSRIAREPFPLDEAIATCRQIARALEAAHKNGVIHRDLKPQNIMVTASDQVVKVLDFGLAKSLPEVTHGSEGLPDLVTEQSTIAGTPGYMSPEQIAGRPLDARTDIWAFGCILYECLSGKRAFPGATIADRIRATLVGEADLDALPSETPSRLRDLVVRCLTLDLEARLATIGEARRAIEEETAQRSLSSVFARKTEESRHPTNLPLQLSTFVGRRRQKEEVRRLLSEGRLITLIGMGGTGKTRLSVEVGRDLLPVFPDGVWMVELAPITDTASIVQTLADVLGVKDEPGRKLDDTVLDHLSDRHLLLVVDNCEHVLDGVRTLLDRVLRRCRDVRILTSSREALSVTGEVLYPVPALAVPAAARPSVRSVLESEAGQLFTDRAEALGTGFTLTDDNAAAVAKICRRLDGIPLALELAAARIRVLPPAEIAQRLDDRFRLLTGGSRTALPHHRTLRALIDWSYDHLEPSEQALLRRLSVFAGGWGLQSGESIGAGDDIDEWEVLDHLTNLIDKSLVEVDPEGGWESGTARYRMLETVRAYARERLEEAGEADQIRTRHRDFYLRLTEQAEKELTGPEQSRWLSRLAANHENLLAAIDTSAKVPGEIELGLRMAGALGRYWFMRGHWGEGRSLLGDLLDRPDARDRTAARAGALKWLGNLAKLQADRSEARARLEESLEISRELGDRAGVAAALANLGNVVKDEGDLDQAGRLFEEALALQRELGNRPGIAMALDCLGVVADLQNNFRQSIAYHEESLAIRRELGDRGGIATSLTNLSTVNEAEGDHDQAIACLEESLDIRRALGDPWGIATTLINLGRVVKARGDYARARDLFEESLRTFRELGDRWAMAASLNNLGTTAEAVGDHERAERYYRESLAIFQDLNDRTQVAILLKSLGSVAAKGAHAARAARLLASAEALREETITALQQSEVAELDEQIGELRRKLGEDRFKKEWTEGRRARMDGAVAFALQDENGD